MDSVTVRSLAKGDRAMVGRSKAIERVRDLIDRYAATRLAILVLGPTGTGKELVAREVHRRSGRPGALTDVNCGALPRELDRKSTRLNSSHGYISYAVFCLKT